MDRVINMTPGAETPVFTNITSVALFWLIISFSIVILVVLTVLIFVLEPTDSSSSSSSTSSQSSGSDSSSSSESTSSSSFPPGGCCDIETNLDTDCAFWLRKDNANPSCVPTFRLTDTNRMIEYNLTQGNDGAGQNVYGSDIVFRTGGTIDPNPALPGPVINTPATERFRIASDGACLFTSDQVVLPSGNTNGFYFGTPDTPGSWRISNDIVNSSLLFEFYDGTNYIVKQSFTNN
jgi:hypothetical protein